MSDPILDAIIGQAPEGMFGEDDETAATSGPYGLGTWKGAELVEVMDFPKSDRFGYKVGLKFDLRLNDRTGGMPYTGRFDLPRTLDIADFQPLTNGHEATAAELEEARQKFEWASQKEDRRLRFLKDTLTALGFTKKQTYTAIDTDEQYNTIVEALRQLIGNRCDLKVAEDGKNVKADDGSWTFVPSEKGYTKFAWIKASRKK